MERESIDFVDKTLNIWNQELLSTSGLLSRIIYNDEFASIDEMWKEMAKDPEGPVIELTQFKNGSTSELFIQCLHLHSIQQPLLHTLVEYYQHTFKSAHHPNSYQ